MQNYPLKRTQLTHQHILKSFLACICCLLLFLTSCADTTTGNSPNTSSQGSQATASKGNENSYENTLEQQRLSKVKALISGMSLDEKLGQLIIVEYFGSDYENTKLPYMIGQQHVGGYLYQQVNHNFEYPSNTIAGSKQFSDAANKDAKIPLLIAIDQEGGVVNKLSTLFGDAPSAEDLAATGDPNKALEAGQEDANHMQQVGINVNLAPVVDVQTATPPLLASRTFGTDGNSVATYAGAFLNGLQKNNVIGCLKHFPGLGSLTSADDPHDTLPIVSSSMDTLQKYDLAPYKKLIATQKPAMIMSTDVVTTAIDPDLPAELSPKAIDGVLRKQLGYNGVVITDGLYMGGLKRWGLAESAVLAIIAGNDLIEGPYEPSDVAGIIQAFKDAIQNGRLTEKRIDESLQRILLMKLQYGIIKA
ncbi:glycoside hydrolase family 3 [Ktedonobacter sp. SOSP1-85]|uniref:glycoside hydrolase family 3 protein n=1 Tax=Ktedonobacter sp. SOSP1-85 TaxID=2778367 RepID=UPI001915258E|nr:glycoside hydrolase family 3 N-terminal domain-containing protein [Ktedonobacter sp. SOSP1-85]GHO77516.1 glycoside hydrolase family 3 [Ktedonobacter sp. SOSP1-85]